MIKDPLNSQFGKCQGEHQGSVPFNVTEDIYFNLSLKMENVE